MLSIYIFTGTDDLASGTMKSVQEQHSVSAEKDLQFEFTPNTEDAVGTCKSRINALAFLRKNEIVTNCKVGG